ncbi:MAG: CapA family protein [Deltaproteobacteria bacterium]|jgi:poly-gamma-glutamate synthesis protein (capsule biosynthesis protein)|nr:CapA family protein [Deltaproteobacteria bacterium]MBW2532898.1 CapA family protein [Deltaproteobacteria bacterium]
MGRLALLLSLVVCSTACADPAPAPARSELSSRVEQQVERSVSAPTAAPAPAAAAAPPAEEEITITVSAIGDCAIGDLRRGGGAPGSFRARLAEVDDPTGYPFSGVAEVLRADDLTIANLEGTLTEHQGYANDVFAIRGKPEYAQMLVRGGIDLVNIENNHAHDYGPVGHADTKAALTAAGVPYFGGKHVDRREVEGVRIVNLGYLGGPAGTREKMERDVERERPDADLLIVSFHWGVEGWSVTHPDQIRLGRAAVDAGADLVLGHHPHRLQGIEAYRDRHIVYSLGNFVFGANSQPEDTDSVIAQERFTLRDGKLLRTEQRLLPASISSDPRVNDFRPMLLEGSEARRVLDKIQSLSLALEPKGRDS